MITDPNRIKIIFDRHVDSMKTRSLKWTFPHNSKRGDKRINKFLKYYFIPVDVDEVMGFLDTTVFKTGKEGYLFTVEGIFIKEVINKLYYLKYEDIEQAEVEEITDEYYNVTTKLWVHFKDGTKKQIFDYYINRRTFADYINDIVVPGRVPESVFMEG
ncbi:MAG: hypothetical protein ACI4HQ_14005 [Acetatifactor sp.]